MKTRIVVNELPDYSRLRKARLGMFSTYDFDTEITYLDKKYCVTYNGKTDIVTSHVSDVMNNIRFARGDRGELTAPLYAKPMRLSSAYYIDIKQAYRQIANVWGAETIWKEGRPIAIGDTQFTDDIFNEKLARGLIISMTGKERHERIWKENQIHTRKLKNFRYAPSLQSAVFTSLHAIMVELMPFIYANTDGIIIHASSINRVNDVMAKYNLSYGVKKQGSVIVYGVGSYTFNDDKLLRKSVGSYCNLCCSIDKRVLPRFEEYSHYRNQAL